MCAAAIACITPFAHGVAQQPPKDTTSGFAITDATLMAKCSSCHKSDSTHHLSRISFLRKSPEGWETSIRRMATLNGVKLDPTEARAIVKYLSNQQGIAPEELRPGRFETERRLIEYRYAGDTKTETVCKACHSLGRVIIQRRTREEWELLLAMHRGYYPDVDFQAFRRFGPPPPESAGAPHPMDEAIAHLAKTFPLRTPEWNAWSATMRPPHIEGTWQLTGKAPGHGAFYGRLTISPGAAPDEYTTRAVYRYASGDSTITREGKAVVYTGFQWRGRSNVAAMPDDPWREVMFVEPGWQDITGRWFKGGYDEVGMDVQLTRLGNNPTIAGVSTVALQRGALAEITIWGANLPTVVQPAAVDFGPGVPVVHVVRATSDVMTVHAHVDSTAALGARDLYIGGASLRNAVTVYSRVDRIKVTPAAGMARVGGVRVPKQLQQFDAVAFANGPDGKPETVDDLELGRVDVTWSLEEYGVTYDDDDLKFVGSIDPHGLFTPNVDGPNPARSGQRNNVGDVWAVATYQPVGKDARPLRARAHLLVTVPLFMRWDPWKVTQ